MKTESQTEEKVRHLKQCDLGLEVVGEVGPSSAGQQPVQEVVCSNVNREEERSVEVTSGDENEERDAELVLRAGDKERERLDDVRTPREGGRGPDCA